MSKIETLGILDEIDSLVSDQLQVVSYKWLSRNFLVSSTAAKRLLQEFVETRGDGLEVLYSLSGWLKRNPPTYHIILASGPKLQEAKQEFDGNCSIQVYSVQACIPKDPAALWNAEYVQAEELFKQPSAVENCLRDNRFCGILNSSVKRHVDGISVSNTPKYLERSGPSKINSADSNTAVPPSQQINVQKANPGVYQKSPDVVKGVKLESKETRVCDPGAKPPIDREKVHVLAAIKKKGESNQSSQGNGSSLENLWVRASAKSKLTSAGTDNAKLVSNPTVSAEAQICVHEAVEDASSDDDSKDTSFKRASNGAGSKKRRVVLDYSDDEYEDAVSLASPGVPGGQRSKTLLSDKPIFSNETEDKPKINGDESTSRISEQNPGEDSLVSADSINPKTSALQNIHYHAAAGDVKKDVNASVAHVEEDVTASASYVKKDPTASAPYVKKDITASAAPNSPKRKKVLKTKFDERGREVTEVVWEGEETKVKKADNDTTKNAENSSVISSINNRAPVAKKSPAVANTAPLSAGGKAGNKKGVNKDPKQGNIMSFFKKV